MYDLNNVSNWFKINSVKANSKKFQYMVLRKGTSDSYVLNIDGMVITSTDEVTLLGVSIDNKLTFKNHIDKLYRKASYKLYALRRIRPFLSKARLLANVFINCQYLYAPLICMFGIERSINKIFRTFSDFFRFQDTPNCS